MTGQSLVAGGDLRDGDGFSVQFSTANAHLIAAAPDLLAALHTLADFVDPDASPPRLTNREACAIARAAIAKAEGR